MRILITNDDGIYASQLLPLVKWAQKLGEVTVVAPKVEQSGKSHGIELLKPFEAKKMELEPGISAYAVDSTPADCVRYAILGLKMEFDLVISGINRGLNIGRDIMYSGTVSAAIEAANLGVKAMAVSTAPKTYETAVSQMDTAWDFICRNRLFDHSEIYNVNLPHAVKGIRITHQGLAYYSDDFVDIGNDMVKPQGKCVYAERTELEYDLDTDAVLHGYISIMPVTIERVNTKAFHALSHLNAL